MRAGRAPGKRTLMITSGGFVPLQEAKETCTKPSPDYTAPKPFVVNALQNSNFAISWDQDAPLRKQAIAQSFSEKFLKGNALEVRLPGRACLKGHCCGSGHAGTAAGDGPPAAGGPLPIAAGRPPTADG